MNKSTQSILLATLLTAAGFASAQNAVLPATRADIKAEAAAETPKVGADQTIKPSDDAKGQSATPANTRAEVKAQTNSDMRKPGAEEMIKPSVDANNRGTAAGNASATTRAKVKSDAAMADRKPGSEELIKPSMDGSASAQGGTSVKSREERRAMAKAKRDARMKADTSMAPAPMTEKTP